MDRKMNRNLVLVFVSVAIAMGFSCLTVNKRVNYIKPAAISIPPSIQNFAVITTGRYYQGDLYNLILNAFSDPVVQQRFKLLDRSNIDRMINEQKLFNSEFFDEGKAVQIGSLAGAQAIIFGEITAVSESFKNGSVVLNRKYVTGKGKDSQGNVVYKYDYKDESVPSTIKTYSYGVVLKIINASNGTVIHSDLQNFNYAYENFLDNKPDNTVYVKSRNAEFARVFPEMKDLIYESAESVIDDFVKNVAPYSAVKVIKFERIAQDNINTRFIKFVESELFDEALELILESVDLIKTLKPQIQSKHFYNLGNLYEIQGNYTKALEYYQVSTKLDPTDLHNEALKTIRVRIDEEKKLMQQLTGSN